MDNPVPENEIGHRTDDGGIGVLEHLTGPSRGRVTWLSAQSTDVALTPARLVYATETRTRRGPGGLVARFQRAGSTFDVRYRKGNRCGSMAIR